MATQVPGKRVSDLAAHTGYNNNDLIMVVDYAATQTKKQTMATLMSNVLGQTYDTIKEAIIDDVLGYVFVIDPDAADQGDNATGNTIAWALDQIAATDNATFLLRHTGAAATTTYTVSTSIDASTYTKVSFLILQGAVFSIDNTKTLTLPSTSSVSASPTQHIFTGSGTVTFSKNDGFAYAEWWGIDGTSDETEINKALTANKKVQLLGNTTYVTDGAVTAVSNGVLQGMDDTTIIDIAGASIHAVTISGVTDFTLKGMRISCSDVTVACYGVNIVNSIRVHGENLYIDDAITSGVIVNADTSGTTQDVRLRNLYITNAGASANWAIQVTCATSSNNNTIERVSIDNVYISGFANSTRNIITNNANQQAASEGNICRDIFWSNLFIDLVAASPDCGGFSGSCGVKNLRLHGFVLKGDTAVSSNYAILIESVDGFSIRDGYISGWYTGIALQETSLTSPVAFAARKGVVDNVEVYDCAAFGVQYGISADGGGEVTNVTLSNCNIHENADDGIMMYFSKGCKFFGNSIWNNTGYGLNISGTGTKNNEDITIIGNLAYDDGAAVQTTGFYLGESIDNGVFKGNQAWGNTTAGVTIDGNGADIHGEQEHVFVVPSLAVNATYGTVTNGVDDGYLIHTAPSGVNGSVILDVLLIDEVGVTAGNPDYRVFTLKGNGGQVITDINTNSAGDNITIAAQTATSMAVTDTLDTDAVLTSGQKLKLAITDGGNGPALTNFRVLVRYVTY